MQMLVKTAMDNFFEGLEKVGSSRILKSTPDATSLDWEGFQDSIDRIINTNKWKLVEETSEKNLTESSNVSLNQEAVILFLHTTATYDIRWIGNWQNWTTYETMTTRKVSDGCTMSTLTNSSKKSTIPQQIIQPRKLWLFLSDTNLSIEPSVRNTEKQRYLDFHFPREYQSGEIFTTLYTSQIAHLEHSWDDTSYESDKAYYIRDRLVTNPRQYKAFVYRSIFPAWYPLKIVTPKNGVLEDGIGSFFSRTVKQNEKEGFPKYYASPKQVEFVKSHTSFTVFHLSDKIIVELQVRGDEANEGFVPPGRYGIACKRPTNQELTEAYQIFLRKSIGGQ
jgi:hypothetical protein